MTIKPALLFMGLAYYAALNVVAAVDAVGGDKAVTVGVGSLVLGVATAAGVVLWRNVQANKQLFEDTRAQHAEAMASALAQLTEERNSHANTRERLDRVERELWEMRHGRGTASPALT